jgi:hypothetical protein
MFIAFIGLSHVAVYIIQDLFARFLTTKAGKKLIDSLIKSLEK